ncbi:hypothetical protein JKP88DRAFT_350674 [Tribonema minus]|uniref:Rhodanese domain-containing protein n=1 Tax=Tribonema minus TaxID=303371 RepID=A0A835YLH4_9STRA|nr:hypothetical protein JKP88DRAFT_350674 [Tribonema minus]
MIFRTQNFPHAQTQAAVLLYYKYVDLGEKSREECRAWYQEVCSKANLCGRVRVALDGVNCTLGGCEAALQHHITQVKAHPVLRGADIDFKLSPSPGALNAAARRESGFDQLSVKAVKEVRTRAHFNSVNVLLYDPAHTLALCVVSLGAQVPAELSARHVSPQEFHAMLAAAAAAASSSSSSGSDATATPASSSCSSSGSAGGSGSGSSASVMLLDARNGYESDIGRFGARGVPLLAPRTRQFSDLPRWIDAHLAELEGRTVLMYCTGGVRCERASAYLRAKGPAFADVVQLSGGIERYLQAFPDGGFFAGKNFVFDERVSVAPAVAAAAAAPAAAAAAVAAAASGVPAAAACSCGRTRESSGRGADSTTASARSDSASCAVCAAAAAAGVAASAAPPAASAAAVVGRCALCTAAWDDYGARARCERCRVLMLVCPACQQQQQQQQQQLAQPAQGDAAAGAAAAVGGSGCAAQQLLCDACTSRGEETAMSHWRRRQRNQGQPPKSEADACQAIAVA